MTREVQTGSPVIDQFPAFEDDGYTKRSGLIPATAFTSTVFQNGVKIVLPVTITEINTSGEYKTSFTPGGLGLYEVQVLIDFNKEIWHAQYIAVAELTHDLAEEARDETLKIDQAALDLPPVVGSLVDHLTNKDGSQTYNPGTDSLEALADSIASGNTTVITNLAQVQTDLSRVLGLLHHNAMLDNQVYDGQGQLTSARLRVFSSAAAVPATPGGAEVGTQEYLIECQYAGLGVVEKFTLKQVL